MPSPFLRFRINRHRRLAWTGSGIAVGLSLLGLMLCSLLADPTRTLGPPLLPGLDFTGGTQIQLERSCQPSCDAVSGPEIQERISGIDLPRDGESYLPNLGSTSVQVLDQGSTILLRMPALSPEQSSTVGSTMAEEVGPLNSSATSVDTIGPTLGAQLLRSSVISLLVSFAAIAAYITFRYSGIFAVLALVCLAHDVLIVSGVFAWLGLLRGIEVDTLFAVSLITVAGYSINDTVVVYDRIREQSKALADLPFSDQVDVAVDATLTRSLYTSFTTLLPLLGLIFFGGASLFWFAVALSIGIAVGSWSSIGLAPTLLSAARR